MRMIIIRIDSNDIVRYPGGKRASRPFFAGTGGSMDQPFAEDERTALPHLEQLLLYSMRAWVIGVCRGLAIAERLDEVFAVIGAPDAAAHLCGFMWAVGNGARRLLAVDCVCRAEVSDDERRLLDVLALA